MFCSDSLWPRRTWRVCLPWQFWLRSWLVERKLVGTLKLRRNKKLQNMNKKLMLLRKIRIVLHFWIASLQKAFAFWWGWVVRFLDYILAFNFEQLKKWNGCVQVWRWRVFNFFFFCSILIPAQWDPFPSQLVQGANGSCGSCLVFLSTGAWELSRDDQRQGVGLTRCVCGVGGEHTKFCIPVETGNWYALLLGFICGIGGFHLFGFGFHQGDMGTKNHFHTC